MAGSGSNTRYCAGEGSFVYNRNQMSEKGVDEELHVCT